MTCKTSRHLFIFKTLVVDCFDASCTASAPPGNSRGPLLHFPPEIAVIAAAMTARCLSSTASVLSNNLGCELLAVCLFAGFGSVNFKSESAARRTWPGACLRLAL